MHSPLAGDTCRQRYIAFTCEAASCRICERSGSEGSDQFEAGTDVNTSELGTVAEGHLPPPQCTKQFLAPTGQCTSFFKPLGCSVRA